ncbi:hypothetical protein BWP39_09360 [Paraburkholderia acidicola]|uniref:Uncharacterized protein n=1 Tax=Paraburkholderia acidicola TaxID=1912599 RepID=A0A2A4F3M3_9BURK|nr:hypothetical protein [Paraburkholderia acidicola]PCE26986.1 hypothetical protein BWP39_09360 [Paraburkholderia acidicola]
MFYDQSWMGYGIIGGMQAGAIAAVIGFFMLLLVHWLTRKEPWNPGRELGVTYMLSVLPSSSGDLWNLFYFNYANLQSPALLRATLADVHDPDSIGVRVLCEFVGIAVGILLAWIVLRWRSRARAGSA